VPVGRGPAPPAEIRNIDLILDIEVEVMVRLGGAVMPLREVQRLRPGSIIDLDKDTEAPMELVVNDKVIAKGELVVVGSDHFALRITEIESPLERIRRLGA
jgi:flagellar motor switch protein FliN/FliY